MKRVPLDGASLREGDNLTVISGQLTPWGLVPEHKVISPFSLDSGEAAK